MNAFTHQLDQHGLTLRRGRLQTLQINVGRKCNQACRHCHVDAGPWRTEMMNEETAHRIGVWISRWKPEVVDLTGGAPELNPQFRYLVETAREAGARVIDRNNLTIIEESAYSWLPSYLAEQEVEIIASLPCYTNDNVAQQRGHGVFERSISALRKLNTVGYGIRLPLHLVYNPVGPKLPGPQGELEEDYKQVLREEYGIIFNRLFTITNQPIARFAEDLRVKGKFEWYLELLAGHFNPVTVDGLMCRTTLNVGYRGELYDCDFNQMLALPLAGEERIFLWDLQPGDLVGRSIATASHCLACTAGCGSSCTGALDQR